MQSGRGQQGQQRNTFEAPDFPSEFDDTGNLIRRYFALSHYNIACVHYTIPLTFLVYRSPHKKAKIKTVKIRQSDRSGI